jgi:hypothetical protein
VSRFAEDAKELMDAAESALRSGADISEMTILISPEGGIRMIAGSDWPLESLGRLHGARMAYRVSQNQAGIRVEGRAEGRSCILETAKPGYVARLLLAGNGPAYQMLNA